MNKIIMASLVAFLCAGSAGAQSADPFVNVSVAPGSIPQSATTLVDITAANLGNSDIAKNSLEITVVAGINAEITGIGAGSDAKWTIFSTTTGTNNVYKLRNTGGPVAAFDGTEIYLNVAGTVVASNGKIGSSIAYLAGPNTNLPGNAISSSQGNGQLANDSSNTTLAVTSFTPLPVHLISFSGAASGCNATLKWQVASEETADHYELQSGTDGKQFSKIKDIISEHEHGTVDYSVTVAQLTARTYYRLKMMSTDGTAALSKTLAIITDCNTAVVAVFPNPATDMVSVTGLNAGDAISVYNTLGQRVAGKVSSGTSVQLNVAALPAGQYCAVVSGSTRTNVSFTKIN